jgi:hypothetical protein
VDWRSPSQRSRGPIATVPLVNGRDQLLTVAVTQRLPIIVLSQNQDPYLVEITTVPTAGHPILINTAPPQAKIVVPGSLDPALCRHLAQGGMEITGGK